MANYTITLTDAEIKAADYAIADIHFWIQNCINVRVGKAQKQIDRYIYAWLKTNVAVYSSATDV